MVALCYWQGLTQEQAAAQLGCPLGTVRSRLARARDKLHTRLTRRGLAPLAGIVAAATRWFIGVGIDVGLGISAVCVPPELVHSTIRAAAQVAGGQATTQVASGVGRVTGPKRSQEHDRRSRFSRRIAVALSR